MPFTKTSGISHHVTPNPNPNLGLLSPSTIDSKKGESRWLDFDWRDRGNQRKYVQASALRHAVI